MWMRSRGTAAAALALLLLLGGAGPSFAAEPSSDSVGDADRSARWIGAWFGEATSPEPAPCDPSTEPAGDACDRFVLQVDVDEGYWGSRDGGVSVGIVWERAADDFDLYVFDGEGNELASSTADTGTAERVTIDDPVGTYLIGVVPVEVRNTGYLGWASLSSDEVPSDQGSAGGASDPSGGGTDPVGTASTNVQGAGLTFADAPYASRTFDSRPAAPDPMAGAEAQDPGASSASVQGSPYADPADPVPESISPPAPLALAPNATSVARPPGSAWTVLAVGILAVLLTGLAVFERFPHDAPEDLRDRGPRRSRLRPRRGRRPTTSDATSLAAAGRGGAGAEGRRFPLPRWG
jgi:hypothetical protein